MKQEDYHIDDHFSTSKLRNGRGEAKLDLLDVGCGNRPHGDINVDKARYSMEIDGQTVLIRTGANVVADALHLPFQDNAFPNVHCSHLIEHVDHPLRLIKELLRISSDNVYIRCPHRFNRNARMPFHKHYFNRAWFGQVLKRVMGITYSISISYWSPLRYLALLQLPDEISVTITKRRPPQFHAS